MTQTPNSLRILSYFYLPDNFKQSLTGPILHESAVPQVERNRLVIPGGPTGIFQVMTKKGQNQSWY